MPDSATTNELFELAIAAERAAETLYQRIAAKFAPYPEVATFWANYAQEEVMHAQWLEQIREKTSPEQLSAPADPYQLENVHRVLQFSIENALADIDNLEDAYQLANDVEHSETNAIFEFLISNFSTDKKVQAFLRSQLRDHVARLMIDLPTQFRHAANRRMIKASN